MVYNHLLEIEVRQKQERIFVKPALAIITMDTSNLARKLKIIVSRKPKQAELQEQRK